MPVHIQPDRTPYFAIGMLQCPNNTDLCRQAGVYMGKFQHRAHVKSYAGPHSVQAVAHTTEEELGRPWMLVPVGVPLIALKMCKESGRVLFIASSTGLIIQVAHA